MVRRLSYMRDWIKVARDLPRTRRKYPDGALVALLFTWCRAAEQPVPGTFETEAVLAALLEERAEWIPFLREKRDLVRQRDGSLLCPHWLVFQEEGKSTGRVRNWRDTQRPPRVARNAGETPDATPMQQNTQQGPPRARVRLEMKDERPSNEGDTPAHGDEPDELFVIVRLIEERTGRPWGYTNGSKALDTLRFDLRDFGAPRLIEAIEAVAAESAIRDGSGLVIGAHHRLNPIPGSKAAPSPKGLGPTAQEADRAFGRTA